MSITEPRGWTDDPEEAAAVEAMNRVVAEMAQALYTCPDARYTDPSGGHRIEAVDRIGW
ncbi:hypothetical protein [Nocardia sp. NPDC003345]